MAGRRTVLWISVLLALVLVGAGQVAQGSDEVQVDCTGDVGDPAPGTPEWYLADNNDRLCATAGTRMMYSNPAMWAAKATAHAADPDWLDDPFREVTRWVEAGRGEHRTATYTDTTTEPDQVREVQLLAPKGLPEELPVGERLPGIILLNEPGVSDAPDQPQALINTWWAAESLAEQGYLVMIASIVDMDAVFTADTGQFMRLETATAATDWFTSTANPWHARLNPNLLGVSGHSGSGGIATCLGNGDPRFKAVVGWDPANYCPFAEIKQLNTPTMMQLGDYPASTLYEPRHAKPVPAPGSKFTWFDRFKAEGVDSMQVTVRATSHMEWNRFAPTVPGQVPPTNVYGEQLFYYYMQAWYDRYLRGALDKRVRADATRRLTATTTFDDSADVHSIGTGRFDPVKAAAAGSVEGGNVPIMIEGLSVRNMLSRWYLSRYFLDGGKLSCGDVRSLVAPCRESKSRNR